LVLLLAFVFVFWWVVMPSDTALLIKACAANSTNAVMEIVQRGTDINKSRNADGKTPLMVASSKGSREVVELLLRLKADKNAVDRYGKTAFDYAMEYHQTNLANILAVESSTNRKQNGISH
jgi:ankyrin repeat protein